VIRRHGSKLPGGILVVTKS